MFTPILLTTLLAAVAVTRADPNPSEPGPGDVFNEGSTCHISWEVDLTGVWKTMNIELMTGSNTGMVHITTVTTVDGTDPTKTVYDYPCPEVTPNSAIYFYQFTSPASPSTLWTTRFAIADVNGKTVPPPNATEPNGDPIPWGTGALVDPSKAVPAPTKGDNVVVPSGGGSSTSNSPASGSSPAAQTSGNSVSSAPPSSPSTESSSSSVASQSASGSPANKAVSISGSGSSSVTSSGAASPTGAASANSAAGMLVANSRVLQAAATLGLVAIGYAVAL